MIINEDNYLELVIGNLENLLQLYKDDAMPSMIDDGDNEDRIEELEKLIKYLQKTN